MAKKIKLSYIGENGKVKQIPDYFKGRGIEEIVTLTDVDNARIIISERYKSENGWTPAIDPKKVRAPVVCFADPCCLDGSCYTNYQKILADVTAKGAIVLRSSDLMSFLNNFLESYGE